MLLTYIVVKYIITLWFEKKLFVTAIQVECEETEPLTDPTAKGMAG
jgi:hypothetical protein